MSTNKSPRTEEEMGDRISGLPEPLLLHILSFLQTKDAVATSLLCKRWRYLWRSLLKLHFDDRNFPSVEFFVQFVDAALHLVRLDSVQMFVLIYVPAFEFPVEVFSNLQFLYLRESDPGFCSEDIPTFHNLIHLQIEKFGYINWSIVKLLRGFPKLQCLIFHKYGEDDSDDDDSDDECLMNVSTPDAPPCVSSHLKELAYFGFEGIKVEFEILEYIMKNATVLRTVIVGRGDTCERNDFEMLKQLSSYPRCSANCRLVYDILKNSIEEARRNGLTIRKL